MPAVQMEDKLNLSSSLRFGNIAQIQIKDASSFSITDFSNNILWTIDTSKNNFFDESGNLIFQDKLNLISSANQVEISTFSEELITFMPPVQMEEKLTLSSSLKFVDTAQIQIKDASSFSIIDFSNNILWAIDTSKNNFFDGSGNLIFPKSNPDIIFQDKLNLISSANQFEISTFSEDLITFMSPVQMEDKLNLSSSLKFVDTAQIQIKDASSFSIIDFSNNILWTIDTSKNNFFDQSGNLIFQDKLNLISSATQFEISTFSEELITFMSPVQIEEKLNLSSSLRFDNIAQIQIKDASSFSITDFSNNILWTIDTSKNNFFDGSGNLIFQDKLNLISSANQVEISTFSEELITFMSPVQMEDKLNLSSSLRFDNTAQIQIKDASSFSITDFSNNILWTIDTSKNNFFDESGNLIFPKSNPDIIFQDKLNLISSANQFEISTFSEDLITFMSPVQMEDKLNLSSSLKFVDTAQIQIKDASSFSIIDFSNNILWTIDTSKNNFFDGSGNLIFQDKLNLISSANQVEISTFSEELITFMSPVQMEDKLNLSSSLRFDNIAQIQIKDASFFSITDFDNNILWTIDTSKNNFLDQSGNLIFQDKLNLISSATQFEISTFSEELITFMSPVQIEDKLNLSSSLRFDNSAQIQIKDASSFSITDFSNNILWTIDTSKNNFFDGSGNLIFPKSNPDIIFQDKLNLISSANQFEISTFSEELITFMPPVQMEGKLTLSSSLKFLDIAQIQVKDASSFSITDFDNNILWTIDTSKNNFLDQSGNLIFQDKLNLISSATQFEISTFSEELITFMSPVQIEDKLNLSSSLRFDNTAQIQIKDASSFSITDFSNNILWTIDTSKNNFFDESGNLIFPKSNPDIIFQDKLNLTSSANQFIDINPLITYNVQNCSELKYLANIQVNPYNLSHNIFLRNILSVENRNNTFSGKIISKDFDGLIMSMTFQGYTTWNYSINTVTYFVNQMISPTPQWNIVGMEIVNSFDLKITLSNPQNTETSWNISIESISI
jgi:hypothetical protein